MFSMKTIAFTFAITLIMIACDPDDLLFTHDCYWYAKNNTDQTLIIITTPPALIDQPDAVVNPGDSVLINECHQAIHFGSPSFELYYIIRDGKTYRNQSTSIYSEDGELLKEWKYIDKDAAGRQLFNESYWRIYDRKKPTDPEVPTRIYTGVFDIIPEDIAPR